jgi:hypothetical protein
MKAKQLRHKESQKAEAKVKVNASKHKTSYYKTQA